MNGNGNIRYASIFKKTKQKKDKIKFRYRFYFSSQQVLHSIHNHKLTMNEYPIIITRTAS